MSKKEILEYLKDIIDTFPGFLIAQQFAWKPHFIRYIFDHSKVDRHWNWNFWFN